MRDAGHEQDPDHGHHASRDTDRVGEEKCERGGDHLTNHQAVVRSG